MTKSEFVNAVKNARGVNLTRREAEVVVNAVFDVLSHAIRRHKKFTFPGFGRFAVSHHKPRLGSDPRTQESIYIKATKSVTFKPAPRLKNSL